MKNNQWYIIFGEDWGRHSSTGQFIAHELAKTRDVLWVNSLGIRTPRLNVSDIKRIINKLKEFFLDAFKRKNKRQTKISNVYIVTPIAIPLLKYRIIRKINQHLVVWFINKKIHQLGIMRPIVISAGPETVDVIDKFNAIRTVYYCADKYTELPGQNKQLVSRLESEMLAKVDTVVVTSRALYSEFEGKHGSIAYLPHGVDHELFKRALRPMANSMPEILKNRKRPFIGFIGLIGPHLNYNIIKYISIMMPESTILMVGTIEDGAEPPVNTNIIYLGNKIREELPNYLQYFDICITPYVESDRIKYANPTKVREYLAAGCPTICTPQEEAKYISNEIYFAIDGAEFVNAATNILSKTIDREKISASVSNQTWEKRVEQLITIVETAATC
jgi:glycosyltransferase involved in cell wall biosynthesis